MSTITTRSGKGSPLTNSEVDSNFTNLNTDKAELSGATFTGEIVANAGIALGDNDKATFGAGDDLQIYHDGNNSLIKDDGTGDLRIRTDNKIVLEGNSGEDYAVFNDNGAVSLNYDNAVKLATTSTGIDVTGTATMDGITVDGTLVAPPIMRINNTGGSWVVGDETGRLQFYTTDGSGLGAREVASIRSTKKSAGSVTGDGTLEFWTSPYNTVAKKSMEIDGNTGDISFYEDTGTTAKLFWDASAESLGIGTSSPAALLDVNIDGNTGRFSRSGTQYIEVSASSGGQSILSTSGTNKALNIGTTDSNQFRLQTNGSNALTIDASQNVGIGTDSPSSLMHLSANTGATLTLESTDTAITANEVIGEIDFYSNDASGIGAASRGSISLIAQDAAGAGSMLFKTSNASTASAERMRIDSSGNVGIGTSVLTSNSIVRELAVKSTATNGVSRYTLTTTDNGLGASISLSSYLDANALIFGLQTSYDEDGTASPTERMRIDSSGKVGIGTDSPSSAYTQPSLHIHATGNGSELHLTDVTTGATSSDGMSIFQYANDGYIHMRENGSLRTYVNGSERMRIDSSGNLLVGTTDNNVSNNSGVANSGINLLATGQIFAAYGGNTANFNRLGDDGGIINFDKDGTTVGSIGAQGGDVYISSSAADHGGLRLANGSILPLKNGALNAGEIDLGQASGNLGFKDLYLSGGVYLGGTGSANKLDDYESGTWVIGLTFGGANVGMTTTATAGAYTKVGNLVTCTGYFSLSAKGSSTGDAVITGLPFTVSNTNAAYSALSIRNIRISFADMLEGNTVKAGTTVALTETTNAGAISSITDANFADNSGFMVSITYRTD